LTQLTKESQKDVTQQLILEFLIEHTNFEITVLTVVDGPLIHPFIPIIQLGLEEVYNKLITMKPELLSTLFFCDYVSGRTTLEFAFTSKNEFFIEPIVKALEKITSFVVHNNTRTLFDILESIFVQLVEEGEIPKDADGTEKMNDDDSSMYAWYRRLADMVYNETRTSSGSKALHIIEKFTLNTDPAAMIEVRGISCLSDRMPAHLQKRVEEGNKRSIENNISIQKKNRKVGDFGALYKLAYKNNNFVTFPLIHDLGKKYMPELDDVNGKFSMFHKNKVIFDRILTKLVDNADKIEVPGVSNDDIVEASEQEDGKDDKPVKEKAKKDSKAQLMTELAGLPQEFSPFLPEFNTKNKFFDELYAFSQSHTKFDIKSCSLNVLCSSYSTWKTKQDRSVSYQII
jgi:hypothetical protein